MSKAFKPTCRRKTSPNRRGGGVTLVELLAVIVIMTLLAAAALPIIAPAMQNRQVREAARVVNSFLSGARNRAMQTGRPVGVCLERLAGLPEACVTLSYAEVPLPYSGDLLGSTVMFGGPNPAGPGGTIKGLNPQYDSNMPPNYIGSGDVGWSGTVRVGDLIKFNYVGHTYQLTGAVDVSNPTSPVPIPPNPNGFLTVAPGPTIVWTYICVTSNDPIAYDMPNGSGTKYQIFRAPVRMAAGSVQLPGTSVIDLTCSGFDNSGMLLDPTTSYPISPWVTTQSFQPIWPRAGATGATNPPLFAGGAPSSDTSNITLTFGPSGAVDRIWCWQFPSNAVPAFAGMNPTPTSFRPTQAIHLMVGQRELLPLPTTLPAIIDPNASGFKPFVNWQDLGNYWVTINPQSGLVTTTEVVQAPFTYIPASGSTPPQYGVFSDLMISRQLARQAHAMGGR